MLIPGVTLEELEGGAQLAEWVANYLPTTTEIVDPASGPIRIDSHGKVVDLRGYLPNPERIKASNEFADAESFAKYVNDFKDADTRIFASVKGGMVRAVLDYHRPSQARWGDHVATLSPMKSPEWAALLSTCGKQMGQVEFAEWLEEWNHIIIDPQSAAMVEVAMNLQGSVNGQFQSTFNRANGSATFSYQEDVTTNQVRVPDRMHLTLSPYWGSKLVNVCVFVRFRIVDKRPKFILALSGVQKIESDALLEIVTEVESATGLPVLMTP